MTKMIVVGHGNFGTGLVSGVKLITGEQPFITPIDFVEGLGTEGLTQKIEDVLKTFDENELVYCFTDLAGGTPFNVCGGLLGKGYNIQLFAGTNLPMLIETSMKIQFEMDMVPDEIRTAGIDNIKTDVTAKRVKQVESDGI